MSLSKVVNIDINTQDYYRHMQIFLNIIFKKEIQYKWEQYPLKLFNY